MVAILKSNMAAMWRHQRWHHLIVHTQKPECSHSNFVTIYFRTKVIREMCQTGGRLAAILEFKMAAARGLFVSVALSWIEQHEKINLCTKFGACIAFCMIMSLNSWEWTSAKICLMVGVMAILKSNMAAMWIHCWWHSLIGQTLKSL